MILRAAIVVGYAIALAAAFIWILAFGRIKSSFSQTLRSADRTIGHCMICGSCEQSLAFSNKLQHRHPVVFFMFTTDVSNCKHGLLVFPVFSSGFPVSSSEGSQAGYYWVFAPSFCFDSILKSNCYQSDLTKFSCNAFPSLLLLVTLQPGARSVARINWPDSSQVSLMTLIYTCQGSGCISVSPKSDLAVSC